MSRSVNINVPVQNACEIEELASNGVTEVYCGVLSDGMRHKFSMTDMISRRQGQIANIDDMNELQKVALKGKELGIRTILAVNMPYSSVLLPFIIELVQYWSEWGGTAIVASDPGLIHSIRNQCPIDIYASIMTNISNSYAVQFFQKLGVKRFVLPRWLSIHELGAMIEPAPELDYEVIVMYDKCIFMDGLCRFYHGTSYQGDSPVGFKYFKETKKNGLPIIEDVDLLYTGHGCSLLYYTDNGGKINFTYGKNTVFACGACSISGLKGAGVNCFKIAGRGLSLQDRVTAARLINQIAQMDQDSTQSAESIQEIYEQVYGQGCYKKLCYYNKPV